MGAPFQSTHLLSDDDQTVMLCENFAREYHGLQHRKDGTTPYIRHPERVAGRLQGAQRKALGWMHDVPEDTGVSVIELVGRGFPRELAPALVALTRKEGETYFDFIMRILKFGGDAVAVKIEDIQDNLEDNLAEGHLKDKYRLALYILQHGGGSSIG